VKKAVVALLGAGVVAAYVYRKQISSKINSFHIAVEDHGDLTPTEVLDLIRDKFAEAREQATGYTSEA
jgi:hypothetical protein